VYEAFRRLMMLDVISKRYCTCVGFLGMARRCESLAKGLKPRGEVSGGGVAV
jgi:hypothetical protein